MDKLIVPILLGWVLGYVVNYLADVLPGTRRLTRPACPNCGTAYPVLGYLVGRDCRTCGKARGLRIWLVLFGMVAISIYVWTTPPRGLGYWLGMALLVYFAVVTVVDIEHRLILHPTSIAGAALAISLGWISHGLIPTVLGGFAGLGIMLVLYLFGRMFSKARGQRLRAAGMPDDGEEALGAGDVILGAILGLMLGWPLIWFGLLLGVLLGGIGGVVLMLSMLLSRQYGRNALNVFMPYGPFFITSAVFITYFPNWIARLLPE